MHGASRQVHTHRCDELLQPVSFQRTVQRASGLMHETRPRPRLPTGRLYQVPEQGQNQPEGDHGSTQGVYDGQKPSDGYAPSR